MRKRTKCIMEAWTAWHYIKEKKENDNSQAEVLWSFNLVAGSSSASYLGTLGYL